MYRITSVQPSSLPWPEAAPSTQMVPGFQAGSSLLFCTLSDLHKMQIWLSLSFALMVSTGSSAHRTTSVPSWLCGRQVFCGPSFPTSQAQNLTSYLPQSLFQTLKALFQALSATKPFVYRTGADFLPLRLPSICPQWPAPDPGGPSQGFPILSTWAHITLISRPCFHMPTAHTCHKAWTKKKLNQVLLVN